MKDSPHNRATTLVASFRCAFDGLKHVIRTERNARIHVVVALAVAAMSFTLGCSALEFAVLILAVGLVVVAEIANTVAETIVDLASPDYHELARISKDVAAGGVLIAAMTSIVIGLIIMGPPLWAFFEKATA
ncbi:MAG: diacylglycerol kinase family protein [Planctomycetaceae bacterium]